MMLLKACSRCGCFVPYGKTYCDKCEPVVAAEREQSKRENNRRYNKTRNPKYTQFYNSIEWRTLSARYAQDAGYRCEECGRIATQVHHKKAIQSPDGWELRLEYNNLEMLCTGCHNSKHERFRKKQRIS